MLKNNETFDTSVKNLEATWGKTLLSYAKILASCVAVRLTGSRDAEELYEFHIRDSLYSVPLLPEAPADKGDSKVIDVGSGGGLPGMVWAICRPDLRVTLLDSARKKCDALREIAAELDLKNVSIVWERCEDHALSAREHYAFASARALAHTGVLAEYLSPLVAQGGSLAAFKGPKGPEELREVGSVWNTLGLSEPRILRYGSEERSYAFVLWEKIAPCPRSYPRKSGMALSKFWWQRG